MHNILANVLLAYGKNDYASYASIRRKVSCDKRESQTDKALEEFSY